jgi:anti-sigma regulatory factor (Ser/Thr protein kinase)
MSVALPVLADVRHFAAAEARAARLPAERVDDLTLAVSELMANTIEHGGGHGTLAIWLEGSYLVCQVSDAGHLTNPMAGRVPVPPHEATGGRGLVMVNQLVDLVRVHTGPGSTTTRLYVNRGAPV